MKKPFQKAFGNQIIILLEFYKEILKIKNAAMHQNTFDNVTWSNPVNFPHPRHHKIAFPPIEMDSVKATLLKPFITIMM